MLTSSCLCVGTKGILLHLPDMCVCVGVYSTFVIQPLRGPFRRRWQDQVGGTAKRDVCTGCSSVASSPEWLSVILSGFRRRSARKTSRGGYWAWRLGLWNCTWNVWSSLVWMSNERILMKGRFRSWRGSHIETYYSQLELDRRARIPAKSTNLYTSLLFPHKGLCAFLKLELFMRCLFEYRRVVHSV